MYFSSSVAEAGVEIEESELQELLVASDVCSAILTFESCHPSQPVESLRRDLHGCRNPRHSGKLGGVGGVSGLGFTHYRRSIRRFSDAGLCLANFNIRTGTTRDRFDNAKRPVSM